MKLETVKLMLLLLSQLEPFSTSAFLPEGM